MGPLIECPGCRRHVRVEDGRCPFCTRPSTTSAPVRALAWVLPLTLMACSGGEGQPDPKAKPAAKSKPTPGPGDAGAKDDAGQPSTPADDGAQADGGNKPAPDREMATKYGAPPEPKPVPSEEPEMKPEPEPKPEPRPARKYGAPPRPKDPKLPPIPKK